MRNRLKVLVFHPALAPYRVDFFNLLAEKVDLEVVFLLENLEAQKFDQDALRARCRFRRRYLTRGFSVCGRFVRFGVRRVLREAKPDVVVGVEFAPLTAGLCLLRPFARWRLWTMCDDNEIMVARCHGLRRLMRAFVMRFVDGVVVTGEAVAASFRAQGFRRPEFAAVPLVHDTAVLRKDEAAVFAAGAAWRREAVSLDWTRLVLYVGRLSPEKNLSWLIGQMAAVPQGMGLLLVGDGPQRAALEAIVAEKGLKGRVRFAGRLEGLSLYGAMAVSDVLALASTSETFGAVVAEGLAWGTPVIVSEFVGAKSLITPENGRVFALTPESFAAALRTVPPPSPDRKPLLSVDLRTAVDELARRLYG